MKGIVQAVDERIGRVAVKTGAQGYTVFELTTLDELHPGDAVRWKHDEMLGAEDITNVTRGATFEVQILGHRYPEAEMQKLLHL